MLFIASVVGRVVGRFDPGLQSRVSNRLTNRYAEGHHTSPNSEAVIFFIVYGPAGPNLGGSFNQRKPQNGGSLHLAFVRPPDVFPSARDDVFDERLERGRLLAEIIDRRGMPEYHNRSVIDRVVK